MRWRQALLAAMILALGLVGCGGGGPQTAATPTPKPLEVTSALDGLWIVIEKADLQEAVQQEVQAVGQSVTVEMETYLFMPAKDPTALYWCNSKEKATTLEGCVKIKNVLTEKGY